MSSDDKYYEVTAHNSAKDSDNLMHDDAVAKSLGFSAGLVPGVDLVAYLSHLPVRRWGMGYVDNGELYAKLLKPVYEGDRVTIEVVNDQGDRLDLIATARGQICIEGYASISHAETFVNIADYPTRLPPDESDKADFDDNSLMVGALIESRPYTYTRESHLEHLESVRETNRAYYDQLIIHPGGLSRRLNWALKENFQLGPWIHASAHLRMTDVAHVGDELIAKAKVIRNDKKEERHKIDLDGIIVANKTRVVARIAHRVYIPNSQLTPNEYRKNYNDVKQL